MTADEIKRMIEAGLPGATVTVRGEDGTHFEAEVAAAAFKGLPTLAQHRLVYGTLGEKMGRDIHALALKTRALE